MLNNIWQWWVFQMRALMPAGLCRVLSRKDTRIVAIDKLPGPDEQLAGWLLLRCGELETVIAAIGADAPESNPAPNLPTGLRLPRDAVLCRDVVLPLAAARDLQTALGFEMDRLTPFTAQELYWGTSELRQDRVRGKLSFNLFFVLRTQVDSLLQPLLQLGLRPSFIEAKAAAGIGRIEMSKSRPAIRWAQRGLPAVCGILALACLVSPFLRQQIALDAAARNITAATPTAMQASALRQKLAIAASGRAAIDQAQRGGDALQVLARLTNALPDGTWLSDLDLKAGDLTFDGRSSNAAALIEILSVIPKFRNPNFTGPVTRTAGGPDQFSMHVAIQQ